jgi:hypothetical protein
LPSGELVGASCAEILQWGSTYFDAARIPISGGDLQV